MGVTAHPITVEVHVSAGNPGIHIVGLAEASVRESKSRVRSAILNSNYVFPAKKITVNLAPASIPKEGCGFDLPIALAILVTEGVLDNKVLEDYIFIGELALSGAIKSVKGVLPLAIAARKLGKHLVIPTANAAEAAYVDKVEMFHVEHLTQVIEWFTQQKTLPRVKLTHQGVVETEPLCLSDIRGQESAKRVLEIAAAGNHHVLFCGPPGSGKTMLASRLPSILPPLSQQQALETAAIYSISDKASQLDMWRRRPFRTPHHSASAASIIGGGSVPRPGEVSLAHNGVLFMDEFTEFKRSVLEVLREPLEQQEVHIARAAATQSFPASFQLIAAMNPCPCGYLGDAKKTCYCTPQQIQRYHAKLSGPLLDRIDLQLFVDRVDPKALFNMKQPTHMLTSDTIRERVVSTVNIQNHRANNCNSMLSTREIKKYCVLGRGERMLLEQAMQQFQLSARAINSVLKVARTIADLANIHDVTQEHLAEALTYRSKIDQNTY